MHTLTQAQSQGLREPIRLSVDASFVPSTAALSRPDAHCVPSVCVTVRYNDDQPVVGLASENFSIVNAEEAFDLTHLFCVTAFASLPSAGVYEIAMDGATWCGGETENQCCLVQVTRVVRSRHAIELGRTTCCMPKNDVLIKNSATRQQHQNATFIDKAQ